MAAIKDYLFRSPERSARHVLTAISGCVLISLGLFYAGLPPALQVSLIGLGVLNLFLGGSELVPRHRTRLAAALRATAYLAFAAGLVLICILLLVPGG